MFYEFINEKRVKKAPRPLKVNGKDVFTTDEEIHNKFGYYRLQEVECPQDEKCYETRYTMNDNDNVIVQSWVEVAIEETGNE